MDAYLLTSNYMRGPVVPSIHETQQIRGHDSVNGHPGTSGVTVMALSDVSFTCAVSEVVGDGISTML